MVEKMVMLIFVLAIEITFLLIHFVKRRWSAKVLGQLSVIFGIGSAFYLSAILSDVTIKTQIFWIVSEGVVLLPALVVLVILYLNQRKEEGLTFQLASASVVLWGAGAVLLTLLTRFWLVGTVQKWDCSEYYWALTQACQNFNFTPTSFFKGFRLLAHPSHGMAFWAAIGEFFTPQNVSGAQTVELLLTCAASVVMFQLFRNGWSRMSSARAFIGTALCLALPLYWGGVVCVMPDYYMLIFALFMIHADIRKNYLLLFVWGAMAAFTKEVGIVVVAAYFAMKSCRLFFSGKNRLGQRFRCVLNNRAIWAGLCIGAALIGYFILNKGVSNWAHSVYYSTPMSWSGYGDLIYNTFGIQWDNIFTRLKEYFVINFQWLILLAALLTLTVNHFVSRKKLHVKAGVLADVSSMLVAYGLFMLLYITAGSIRYNVMFTVMLTAMAYLPIAQIASRLPYNVTWFGMISILVAQSFYPIDPVTNWLFDTVDVGNTKLLCIAQEAHENPGGDYYITNLQYRTISENFEKMLDAVDFQEEDYILIAGKDYIETQKNASLSELGGRHSDMRWDPENKIYINSCDEQLIIPKRLTTNTLWSWVQFPDRDETQLRTKAKEALSQIEGRIFVYFSPLFQSEDEETICAQLARVFELGEMQQVETWGNVLRFCELTVKDSSDWTLYDNEEEMDSFKEFAMQQYYASLRKLAVDSDGSRTEVREGDAIAVIIACYDENGAFINSGLSPRGTINRNLVLGVGALLDGVDEQIIGHHVGETIKVTCEVPEDYSQSKMAGKTITMDIEILSIINQLPEMTEEDRIQHLADILKDEQ